MRAHKRKESMKGAQENMEPPPHLGAWRLALPCNGALPGVAASFSWSFLSSQRIDLPVRGVATELGVCAEEEMAPPGGVAPS
jgi:hypothetical protein